MANIYGKLAAARAAFHELKLQKSGENRFAGYKYFELSDFLIPGMKVLADNGLVPIISFDSAQATMTVHETDGDHSIVITSPMADATLKAAHPIQNLGAVETYQRRYLWMALLEIVEHDAVDSAPPAEEQKVSANQAKAIAAMVEETGADLPKMLQFFKVKSLDDLTANQAKKAFAMLEKKLQKAAA